MKPVRMEHPQRLRDVHFNAETQSRRDAKKNIRLCPLRAFASLRENGSMNSDSRIPTALDEFLSRLRADLDAHGAALTANVLEQSQQGDEAWQARIDTRPAFQKATAA